MLFRQRRVRKAARKQEEEAQRQAITKKENQAQKTKELEDLLDRAEQSDAKAQNEIVNRKWRSTDPVRKKRIATNARIVRVRREYNNYGGHALERHAVWQESLGTDREIFALSSFLIYYQTIETEENLSRLRLEFGIRRKEASRRLQSLINTRYEELLSQVQDVEKFKELWDFIRLTRGKPFHDSRGEYRYDSHLLKAAKPLSYPDNWNDLVAGHFYTPSLEMFRELPDRGSGDVRLLAADAIRTNDFTQAQIALAYCNIVWRDGTSPNRDAVGDVLTAELAKLVMRHRAEIAQAVETAAE